MTDDLSDDSAPEVRRYRAPALDKGLDILELMAAAPHPLGVSAIVKALGRISRRCGKRRRSFRKSYTIATPKCNMV
jgi:hypothetical protein